MNIREEAEKIWWQISRDHRDWGCTQDDSITHVENELRSLVNRAVDEAYHRSAAICTSTADQNQILALKSKGEGK